MQGLYLVFPCLRMESCSNEIFYLICSFVYISPWNKFFVNIFSVENEKYFYFTGIISKCLNV